MGWFHKLVMQRLVLMCMSSALCMSKVTSVSTLTQYSITLNGYTARDSLLPSCYYGCYLQLITLLLTVNGVIAVILLHYMCWLVIAGKVAEMLLLAKAGLEAKSDRLEAECAHTRMQIRKGCPNLAVTVQTEINL